MFAYFFFQEMKIAVHIMIIWQLATVQMVRKKKKKCFIVVSEPTFSKFSWFCIYIFMSSLGETLFMSICYKSLYMLMQLLLHFKWEFLKICMLAYYYITHHFDQTNFEFEVVISLLLTINISSKWEWEICFLVESIF